MSCNRENKSIWWRLFGFWRNYAGTGRSKWRGWELLSRRFWRHREYIWHDSVGRYWNRWVACPLIGHRNVQDVADCGEPKLMHCFKCEQDLYRTLLVGEVVREGDEWAVWPDVWKATILTGQTVTPGQVYRRKVK